MTSEIISGSTSNRFDAFMASVDGDFLPHRRQVTDGGAINAASDLTLR